MEAKAETLNRLSLPHTNTELLACPACEIKLSPYEVAQHCEQEVEQLRNIQLKTDALLEKDSNKNTETTEETTRQPWTVFKRVQRNRHSRLKQRLRKKPHDEQTTSLPERNCPMCNKSFPQSEIEQHAEACLRHTSNESNGGGGQESSDDEIDGDQFEEYEWAGQKRIRVSSLLEGGYAALGIGSNGNSRIQQCSVTEEDEDLNVDEDDTHIYGPAQYDESDIIAPGCSNGETEYLSFSNDDIDCTSSSAINSNDINEKCQDNEKTKVQQQIIDSLKAKLKQYEKQLQSKFKCLICLDDYRNPAISVSCWHVHCEECWLRSLGARKLCPRCNLITTPNDLRRIFM